MKIVVLGSKGQLGCCLSDQLIKTKYDVVYLSRENFDVGDLGSLREKISLLKPNLVINASAYTAVDMAETNHQEANLINHVAVAKLADICEGLNAWLFHISSDYVFDGTAVKPYSENSKTNPQSIYGESKLKGELAIISSGCKYIIIRTAWVFSEYGNNFLKTMLRLGAKHKELNIVDDQIGCPTYAQDIAKTIVLILSSIDLKKSTSGIFHYCGNQPCSWYDFANSIFIEAKAKGYKVPTTLNKVSSIEFKSLAPRPLFSVLNCSNIKAEFDIDPSYWIDGIKDSIKRMSLDASSIKQTQLIDKNKYD